MPHSPRRRREVLLWRVCRGGGRVSFLGKKLMLDALPSAIEKGKKCCSVHRNGERYGGCARGGGRYGMVPAAGVELEADAGRLATGH